MALTDVDARRTELNAAIANYKQTVTDFATGAATQTQVDAAKTAAQQAGDALAKEMGATKKASPELNEDDFFSNPGLQNGLVRADVSSIMTTGQFFASPLKMMFDTEGSDAGVSNIVIPFDAGSDVTVDWGDGSNLQTYTGAASHNYATPGQYEVLVTGTVNGFTTPAVENRQQLKDVSQWGEVQFAAMDRMFERRLGFTISASDKPIFIPNATCEYTFFYAEDFNSPIGHWDMGNVVSLKHMLGVARLFNQPLNDWNVSNVTDFDRFLSNQKDFNQPLNNWDVSSATNMRMMFYAMAKFNQPLNNWNVGNVTTMEFMFDFARDFNQDLSMWDVSKVTNYNGFNEHYGIISAANLPNFT